MKKGAPAVDLDEARERRHAGLLAEIAQGGRRAEQAMEKLFHDYEGRITGWCRHQFRLSLAEAEDLWQDVVVSIWRSAAGFRGEASVKSWIYKLARNRALDLLDRASRKSEQYAEDDTDLVDSFAAPPTGPSDVDRCVRIAFARFAREHPDKADWIAKADVLEHDIPEIAAELDRSLVATRQHLSKLRKALRPFLAPCLDLLKP